MQQFIIRLSLFLSLPFSIAIFVISLYIKRDVYADFGSHKNYSWKYAFQHLGDISTKKLLNSTIRYDSFIFGSSRSVSLYACYLQKKIPGSRFFHYANWNETIGGIHRKILLLDKLGYNLKNVIVYLYTDFAFNGDGHPQPNDHYLLTGQNRLRYYYKHFRDFLSFEPDRLRILLGLPVSGSIYPNWESDLITNDGLHICSYYILSKYGDKTIGKNLRVQIDNTRKGGLFFPRGKQQQFKSAQISENERNMLGEIGNLLRKHMSKYYIVVTPLYDQLKFNASDMKILDDIFGQNLYDFSGINAITNDENNFPDRDHFRPYISKEIMDQIILSRDR